MPPSSPYDSQVYVYALAQPATFAQESNAITRLVLQALKVAPSVNNRLTLSADSGWFDFTAIDELWERGARPSLPEKAAAQRAAEAALTAVERACSDTNPVWPKTLAGLALLPPVGNLRRARLKLAARRDGSGPDHWLYRAEPQLVLDGGGKTRVGVFGAGIEVRIGHMGRVIGLRSRFSPLSGEKILTELSQFSAPDDSGGHSPPFINYILEGDGIPQFYLAPYYFQSDGHDIDVSSASPYSLTVDLARIDQTRTGLSLAAVARGGSGNYLYNWASYSLLAMAAGIRELGSGEPIRVEDDAGAATGSLISLDNTPSVALLNVKDTKTGAFKHVQQPIFPSPWLVGRPDAVGQPAVA